VAKRAPGQSVGNREPDWASHGIDKKLAKDALELAALSEDEFAARLPQLVAEKAGVPAPTDAPTPTTADISWACSIKPARRSKADIEAIKDAILEVVEEDPPMTVRQVFYQLVVRGVIEKTEKEYQGTVIRLLTDMRLNNDLPFSYIVDERPRRPITVTYDNLTEAVDACARFYRRSALREASSDYIEIWCEKEALAGLLWDVTSEYDVPLMVSKGMPSLTFLHGTAEEIRKADEAGQFTYIYQFGDHDPSGVLIPRTIKSRLDEMCERSGCTGPIIQRVALTEEQISEFNLPTRPTKREGNRHAHSFEGESVELDALPPSELRAMVREVIERHITEEALTTLRTAEESERELLSAWAANLPGEAAP